MSFDNERRHFYIPDIDIRIANVRTDLRQRMKELSIGNNEVKILDLIDQDVRTSSEIANCLNKNVNSISTQLKNLYKKGYVTRRETHAESGGLEYRYYCIYTNNNTIKGINC